MVSTSSVVHNPPVSLRYLHPPWRSVSPEKKQVLLLSPGLVVVEIWESDYFKNQLSTSPHLSLSDAPSPASSRQYPPLSCGSHVHGVGFFLPSHQFSRPSAFQVTKCCSSCLHSSSSFPLGLKTFKNHFRIILWGTWQGVKAFNLPSLHRNLQIPSAFCLTTLLPRNQPPQPVFGASAVSPPYRPVLPPSCVWTWTWVGPNHKFVSFFPFKLLFRGDNLPHPWKENWQIPTISYLVTWKSQLCDHLIHKTRWTNWNVFCPKYQAMPQPSKLRMPSLASAECCSWQQPDFQEVGVTGVCLMSPWWLPFPFKSSSHGCGQRRKQAEWPDLTKKNTG